MNYTTAAREALGLRRYEKLPTHGLPTYQNHEFIFEEEDGVQHPTYAVRLLPQGPQPISRNGRPLRRMAHRLQIACLHCGCWFPTGRLRQHERACKQR